MLSWTENQVAVFFALKEGGTITHVAKTLGISKSFVFKIKEAMASGDKPPDGATASGNGDKPSPGGLGKIPHQILKFIPKTLTCELTPIMYSAYNMAVLKQWIKPDTTFEDFLDTILYHAFLDRNVILQGAIDLNEENNNGGHQGLQQQPTEAGVSNHTAS